MIISTYNPNDARATCPKCGLVECTLLNAILIGGYRRLEFYHEECGTTWEFKV